MSAEDEASRHGIVELRPTITRLAERLGVPAPQLVALLRRWQRHRISSRSAEDALIAERLAPAKDPISINADRASGGAPNYTCPANGVTLSDDTDTLREQGSVVKTSNGARAVVPLLTVVAALGLASCGGSSSPTISTRPTRSANASLFNSRTVVCLKGHGVTSTFHLGGRHVTLAARIRAQLRDCGARSVRSYSGYVVSGAAVKMLDAYAACVAKHGYKLPRPNVSGKGPVFPAGTDQIRKYREASNSCISIVRAYQARPQAPVLGLLGSTVTLRP